MVILIWSEMVIYKYFQPDLRLCSPRWEGPPDGNGSSHCSLSVENFWNNWSNSNLPGSRTSKLLLVSISESGSESKFKRQPGSQYTYKSLEFCQDIPLSISRAARRPVQKYCSTKINWQEAGEDHVSAVFPKRTWEYIAQQGGRTQLDPSKVNSCMLKTQY